MPDTNISEKDVSTGDWPKAVFEESSDSLVIIPDTFGDKYNIYPSTTETVLKLLRKDNVAVALYDKTGPIAMRDNRSVEWVAPALFISQMYWSQNPDAVSISLNVLSSYVYELFRGRKTDPSAKFRAVVCNSQGNVIKELTYEGPVSGVQALSGAVKRLLG